MFSLREGGGGCTGLAYVSVTVDRTSVLNVYCHCSRFRFSIHVDRAVLWVYISVLVFHLTWLLVVTW